MKYWRNGGVDWWMNGSLHPNNPSIHQSINPIIPNTPPLHHSLTLWFTICENAFTLSAID